MPLAGKTKQDVVSEFRSAEILDAARRVFFHKGFNDATMDDIAEAAGVAKGTLYLYFASKRDVYLAAVKRGLGELIEDTRRSVEAASGTAGKLRAIIATRIRYAEENRDFFAAYHLEFANVSPSGCEKEFHALYLEHLRTVERVLREGAEAGLLRPVRADAAAVLIYEMTRAMVMQRRLKWSKGTAAEDVDLVFDLVWKGLAAE